MIRLIQFALSTHILSTRSPALLAREFCYQELFPRDRAFKWTPFESYSQFNVHLMSPRPQRTAPPSELAPKLQNSKVYVKFLTGQFGPLNSSAQLSCSQSGYSITEHAISANLFRELERALDSLKKKHTHTHIRENKKGEKQNEKNLYAAGEIALLIRRNSTVRSNSSVVVSANFCKRRNGRVARTANK